MHTPLPQHEAVTHTHRMLCHVLFVHRLPARPTHCRVQQPVRLIARASKAANNSFDAEEDLDADLAEELSRFRSPDTWNKVAQHLDLVWKIGRVGVMASGILCVQLQA